MECGAGIRADFTIISWEWLCRPLVASDGLASPFAQVRPWLLPTDDSIPEGYRLPLLLPGPISALWRQTQLPYPLAAGRTPWQVQPLLSLCLAKDLFCQTKSCPIVRSFSTASIIPIPTFAPNGSYTNTLLLGDGRHQWSLRTPTSTKERISNRVSGCLHLKCQPFL